MIVKDMFNNDAISIIPYAFSEDCYNRLIASYVRDEDRFLKKAFIDKGFPTNEEFIKTHCCVIRYPEDRFEHVWYHFGHPDAVRIISIEKETRIEHYNEGFKTRIKAERYYFL